MSKKSGLPYDDSYMNYDIIDIAKNLPLGIIILGRPRSGKTILSKILSDELGLVNLSIEQILDKNMTIFNEANELGEEEIEEKNLMLNKISKTVKTVIGELLQGSSIEKSYVLEIFKESIQLPETSFKGFIIDLPSN